MPDEDRTREDLICELRMLRAEIACLRGRLEEIDRPGDDRADMSRRSSESSADAGRPYRAQLEHRDRIEPSVRSGADDLNSALCAARAALDWLNGIVKSVADGLIVTDTSNRMVLINPAAERLLHADSCAVLGKPLDVAIEDEPLRERLKAALERKEPSDQFIFELPGEDPRIMQARTSLIHDAAGKEAGVVTIMTDVTEERAIDRMKTQFLARAAHQLRTPLTSIRGFSEILVTRDDIGEDERKKFLFHINKEAETLASMLRDILDVSRLESGLGYSLRRTRCDASGIVRRAVDSFRDSCKKHRIQVSMPDQLPQLLVDGGRIEQVLDNIIGNAIKYSPEGGNVRVIGRVVGDFLEVSVEDEGIGMTEDQAKRFFEKFYKADVSNTAPAGTGLGTTIVKHIVEAHGGRVWVDSVRGKGTAVRFTLPLASPKAEKRPSSQRPAPSRGRVT